MESKPFDFSNVDAAAIADELAAKGTSVKEKKPAKPKVLKVSFVADRDISAGEVVTFNYEVPKSEGTRGQVAGLALDEMNNDQLKIEYRNANSVFYKTKKAGRDASKAGARLDAVKAEMETRGIQPTGKSGTAVVTAESIAALIKNGQIKVEDIQAMLDSAAE